MQQQGNRILNITVGKEYSVNVESILEMKDSFLFDMVYARAIKRLGDVLEKNILFNKKLKSSTNGWDYNNIIAFVGDRGQGKSSAMLSLGYALCSDKKNELINNKIGSELFDFSSYHNSNFCTIDVIDPSLFEANEDIIGIIIAKMFSKFKIIIESNNIEIDFESKRNLLKRFQLVFENIKTIKQDKTKWYDGQEIEVLEKLAAGSNLKNNIQKLVKDYLDFISNFSYGSEKNNYLLLMIDDFDLNIDNGYTMSEQIRKYFILPNVIIFMALNINQLRDTIQQNYIKLYRTALEKNELLSENSVDLAIKYIDKFIPERRRIYLPDIKKEAISRELIVNINDNNISKYSNNNIQKTIFNLIYDKTGMIFIENESNNHLIIPKNLRDYISLINILYNLSGGKKDNFLRFKNYFINKWLRDNLLYEHYKIIDEFSETSYKERNKFIVNKVDYYCAKGSDKEYKNKESKIDEYKDICNIFNNNANVSFGDVLYVLNYSLLSNFSTEFKSFIFAIKTLYSFTFYEMLFIKELYKLDDKDNELQDLLGGSIYNSYSINFLRINEKTDYSNFAFDFSKTSMFDSISKVHEIFENNGDDNAKSELIKLNQKCKMQLWFPFFISIYNDKNILRRTSRKKRHDLYLGFNRKSMKKVVTFDLFGFCSEIYYPERVLKRFFSVDDNHFKILKEIFMFDDFLEKIKIWRSEYKTFLPIYSVELFEKIISTCEFKSSNYDIENIFNLFNLLVEVTKKILEKNTFIEDDKIYKSILNFPLISFDKNDSINRTLQSEIMKSVFDNKVRPLKSKILDLFDKLKKMDTEDSENMKKKLGEIYNELVELLKNSEDSRTLKINVHPTYERYLDDDYEDLIISYNDLFFKFTDIIEIIDDYYFVNEYSIQEE
ncbi:MAG: hypothetical protein JW870_01025 [Candidatus Delongbacteria bacterium]|nr:hypothetical protein [Candidatus Delongbacteria bacterium]